jgi:hypothetical protein
MARLGAGDASPSRWLIEQIGRLSPAEIGGLEGFRLYKHLRKGAYRHVSGIKDVQEIRFPNRHATIHGVTEETDRIDSLNALLFGNFVFRALGSIEKASLRE